MGQFDSFYQGSMAPPLTVDGRLIPTPTILSPAQIYAGIYPSTPTPQMSSIGPGPGPSGGYSFLQDMIDASTPSKPAQVARSTGLPPSLYGGMQGYQDSPSMIARNRDPGGGYSDPLTAIDNITSHGGSVPLPRARPAQAPSIPVPSSPWGLPWNEAINMLMPWETAQTGAGAVPAPGGDPWGRLRANGYPTTPNRPGMITGSRPAAAPQTRAAAPQMIAPAVPADQRFLQDRGVNTQGLNVSQIANELNKQMASSSRNSDGSRGFGV